MDCGASAHWGVRAAGGELKCASRLWGASLATCVHMNTPGFRLGSVLGVEIRLDWSLIIIVGLITASLGTGIFPLWHPEWARATSWGTAIAAATLFPVSILLHELAHALAGRLMGTPIHRGTLFLFGRLGSMQGDPKSAG